MLYYYMNYESIKLIIQRENKREIFLNLEKLYIYATSPFFMLTKLHQYHRMIESE